MRAEPQAAPVAADGAGELTVRVLLFALYRELAGADEVELRLPAGARVADAVARLRERGGAWERLPVAPLSAVNREYAGPATRLAEGDELALIPPVSGG